MADKFKKTILKQVPAGGDNNNGYRSYCNCCGIEKGSRYGGRYRQEARRRARHRMRQQDRKFTGRQEDE